MLYRRSRFLLLLTVFCPIAITPTRGFSQNAVSGTVLGTVFDSSGAAVPGAAVALQNVANGVGYQTQTNDSGNYTFTNVQPRNYTVTVTKTGFQGMKNNDVVLGITMVNPPIDSVADFSHNSIQREIDPAEWHQHARIGISQIFVFDPESKAAREWSAETDNPERISTLRRKKRLDAGCQ